MTKLYENGEKMIELINRPENEMEVNTMSPLTWAYVGDIVSEV